MSTLRDVQPTQAGTPSPAARFEWRTFLARVAGALKTYRNAHKRLRDGHFRRERSAQERFLSKATDHRELEHLERAWEHRHVEMWRI